LRFTRRYASPRLISKKMHDIGPEEEAVVAMKKMTEPGIRRLPVIVKGRIVSILSREDLVMAGTLCSVAVIGQR